MLTSSSSGHDIAGANLYMNSKPSAPHNDQRQSVAEHRLSHPPSSSEGNLSSPHLETYSQADSIDSQRGHSKTAHTSSSDTWAYSVPTNQQNSFASRTPAMIGPTPTFHRSGNTPAHEHDREIQQYQQWIDNFANQQSNFSDLHYASLRPPQHQFTFRLSEYPTNHNSHPHGSYVIPPSDSIVPPLHNAPNRQGTNNDISYHPFYIHSLPNSHNDSRISDLNNYQHLDNSRSGALDTVYPPQGILQHLDVELRQQQFLESIQQEAPHPGPESQLHHGQTVVSPIQAKANNSAQDNSNHIRPAQESPTSPWSNSSTSRMNDGRVQNEGEQSLSPSSRRATTGSNGVKRPSPQTSPTARGPAASQTKRKRPRKDPNSTGRRANQVVAGSDTDSEDESENELGGGISVGMGGLGVIRKGSGGLRLHGACSHCKKLKMKCDFPKGDNTCKRCKSGGHVCIVEGRKPRTAPNKREYLLAQIRQKDAIIESLLKQLHNPYLATPLSIASYRMATSPSDRNNRDVLDWLDRMKSSVQGAGGKAGPRAFVDHRPSENIEQDSDQEVDGVTPQSDDDAHDCDDAARDEKLSTLPDTHVPIGLLADLSLSTNKKKHGKKDRVKEDLLNDDDFDDDNVGVANETYFMPGPATDLNVRAQLIEQHSPPEILVHGLVTPEDVDKLFEIFYEHVNPFISLLDPVLHTPASTFARCPFLFTVICAISSRYYPKKSEIYPIAMHFAKHSAANALIDGWKSVELCQAYILMSIYAVPARRWEEDRSWLYTGLAIRIATDLNLHLVSTVKPQTEKQEREILNKTRVWMICFNLDRSTATQFGKPSTIKEDYIIRSAREWYKRSKYNHPYDLHLCAYSALLQIVARFHNQIFSDPTSPTGLNKRADFRSIILTHDGHLTRYHEEWTKRFLEDSDPNDRSCAFRCSLLPFLVGYSRLVMFSFGFQQAYRRGLEPGDQIFFNKCLSSAKSVIANMIEGLVPSGYMRYAPDGHFVFASFASAFLLKLLRPEFSKLLPKEEETEVFDLIGRLIQTLSSSKIAIDDRHTPKLYARFLAGLLSRHRRDGATVGRLHTAPAPHNQMPPPSGTAATLTSPASSGTNMPDTPQSYPAASPTKNGPGRETSFSIYDKPAETIIYRPEATFTASTGPIVFGSDFDVSMLGANGVSDEEMLATMQAIKSPTFWDDMMMPGFSWPEQSPSPSSSGATPPAQINNYNQGVNHHHTIQHHFKMYNK
ncbi:hypothetical protein AMATHDRAFT_65250 [Amanita thiersii Skay4041]|uniref:Zn(2)-C6 fungal-type domain-containing protein n=1 Tax=Amanita thiersii Skay4041 TaxID=703135 RepID=A0A2A9NLB2_9AGAR|nr:hypothetical protein AMATHDRAFT_65250 [Amanita thiersii Skay4041]